MFINQIFILKKLNNFNAYYLTETGKFCILIQFF